MSGPRFRDLAPLVHPRCAGDLIELDEELDRIQDKHHPGSWPMSADSPGFLEGPLDDDESEEP